MFCSSYESFFYWIIDFCNSYTNNCFRGGGRKSVKWKVHNLSKSPKGSYIMRLVNGYLSSIGKNQNCSMAKIGKTGNFGPSFGHWRKIFIFGPQMFALMKAKGWDSYWSKITSVCIICSTQRPSLSPNTEKYNFRECRSVDSLRILSEHCTFF